MELVDVHSHITDHKFDIDRTELIHQAQKASVKYIVCVSENFSDSQNVLSLCQQFQNILRPSIGLHPVQHINETENRSVHKEKDEVEKMMNMIKIHHEDIVCIGEVGLDFSPHICTSDEDKSQQRDILMQQIHLANQFSLPLNVHSRSAGRPTIHLLREYGAKNVVLHAFDGKASVAQMGIEAGYYFSVPPSIFRSDQMKNLFSGLPIENLLLETDAPALSAIIRERNQPDKLHISCEELAKIKGINPEVVAKITSENAKKLFPRLEIWTPKTKEEEKETQL